ncbi:MAG: SPOR domain-containing protein [Thiohalocapsa sp.]
MDEGAKRRLVGAAVVVALAVIFVPMLLNDKEEGGLGEPIVIPDAPEFDAGSAGTEDGTTGDTAGDMTPALPRPEPPTSDFSQGADSEMAPRLPVPEPVVEPAREATERSTPRAQTRTEASSQPSADARAVPPARRPPPAAIGPKPVPEGAAAWVIQVASLGSAASAENLRDELRGKGYPAFVEQARVNGKLYYRVRVGPETNRGRADGVAAKLQRETGNKPLVQSYR